VNATMKTLVAVTGIMFLAAAMSASGQAIPITNKVTIEDRGCEEPWCLSHAHATSTDGKTTVNLILMCVMKYATCAALSPFTTFTFDWATEPTQECPKPRNAKLGTACVVIHARPHDLRYLMTTMQTLCGSNDKRCM
jgi:hypothetical protein